MSFIVIEGDNGTGKDTLALNIQDNMGYKIITNEPKIKELNRKAKEHFGEERVKRFLEYGKACSNIANNTTENHIIVRYWISTLAAAYADNIYTYKQTLDAEKIYCSELCKPDAIICLWCDYKERTKRIKTRNSKDFDDITKQRNEKYRFFLKIFETRTNIKWINIDTTNKTRNEVFKEAYKYISYDNN